MLAGSLALVRMPVAEYPEIAPPQVLVRTNYPGASAQDIVDSVAAPIEVEMNGLEHLLYYSSTSSNTGMYELSLVFDYGTNGDIAQVNVHNAIKCAEPFLPADVKQQGIEVHKRSSDLLAVCDRADPELFPLNGLATYVKTMIVDPLSRVDGVESRNVQQGILLVACLARPIENVGDGNHKFRGRLGHQVTEYRNSPVRRDRQSNDMMQFKINVKGRLTEVSEFENIVIKSDERNIVKLRDIARVEMGSESYANTVMSNGKADHRHRGFRNIDANALEAVQCPGQDGRAPSRFPDGVSSVLCSTQRSLLRFRCTKSS